MVNKPKNIGTAFETGLVRYLEASGLKARRVALAGALDQGDVHAEPTPGGPTYVFECKAGKTAETASQGLIETWWQQTLREARNTTVYLPEAFLVTKRAGVSSRPSDPLGFGEHWVWLKAAPIISPISLDPPILMRCRLSDITPALQRK